MTERITSDFDAGKRWNLIERDKPYSQVYRRLEEYETAEEEGRLVVLPCDIVYFICDKGTKYAHVRTRSILDLYLHEILGIDRDGRYWSAREEAEKALKENEENADRRALD